jgi:hypothetical protein
VTDHLIWGPKASDPAPSGPTACNFLNSETSLSVEERAVLAAEEFIRRNGYTDRPADPNSMVRESIEWWPGVEEALKFRHDTLRPKAFGLRYERRLGVEGWTVVFRYTNRVGGARMNVGRAVTMDEKFENLRVEHCDFFLDKVEKKL